MKILACCLLILTTLNLCGASCAQGEAAVNKNNTNTYAKEHLNNQQNSASCKNNNECALIQSSCCGCNEGGKQRPILKAQLQAEQDKLLINCDEVMCIKVISQHASCKQKAVCESGQCVLK
jgi:hypothetical protein